MGGSLKLRDYPADMVRLACNRCGRAGQYGKATLIAQFGAEIALPDLRNKVAKCERADKLHDTCGVHYPDLITA